MKKTVQRILFLVNLFFVGGCALEGIVGIQLESADTDYIVVMPRDEWYIRYDNVYSRSYSTIPPPVIIHKHGAGYRHYQYPPYCAYNACE